MPAGLAESKQKQQNGVQETGLKLSKEEEALFDDDDLEDDELDELEAKLEQTHV